MHHLTPMEVVAKGTDKTVFISFELSLIKYKKKKKNNKKKLDSILDSMILLFEMLHKLILAVSDCVTNSVTTE